MEGADEGSAPQDDEGTTVYLHRDGIRVGSVQLEVTAARRTVDLIRRFRASGATEL